MAGSIAHCTDESGNFTMGLLDNMGDAEEALREYHAEVERMRPVFEAVRSYDEHKRQCLDCIRLLSCERERQADAAIWAAYRRATEEADDV